MEGAVGRPVEGEARPTEGIKPVEIVFFGECGDYRPNRLLGLLSELRTRTRDLLLLTATPMQIHPVEVWDLLRLLGLGGRWGAGEEYFLRFFAVVDNFCAPV